MLKLKCQYIEIAFLFWYGGSVRFPFSIAIYYPFSPLFVKQQFTVSPFPVPSAAKRNPPDKGD